MNSEDPGSALYLPVGPTPEGRRPFIGTLFEAILRCSPSRKRTLPVSLFGFSTMAKSGPRTRAHVLGDKGCVIKDTLLRRGAHGGEKYQNSALADEGD